MRLQAIARSRSATRGADSAWSIARFAVSRASLGDCFRWTMLSRTPKASSRAGESADSARFAQAAAADEWRPSRANSSRAFVRSLGGFFHVDITRIAASVVSGLLARIRAVRART